MENSNRYEFFMELRKNAEEIKETLLSDNLQLAKLDTLFRERNKVFSKLKDILVTDSIGDKEEELMKEMIDDNNFILKKMEDKKKEMGSAFQKKENDASKISKYSTENLKG